LRAGLNRGHVFVVPKLLFILSAPTFTGSLLLFVAESTEASFWMVRHLLSVADPGCLSLIRMVPLPDTGSASKN
jgi:hypothetical protein